MSEFLNSLTNNQLNLSENFPESNYQNIGIAVIAIILVHFVSNLLVQIIPILAFAAIAALIGLIGYMGYELFKRNYRGR